MPRTRVYPNNAARQAAYRQRKVLGVPAPIVRRARSFDRGVALLQLHEHLRAGRISETTFQLGVEHVFLADEHGTHCTSRAELARRCSGAWPKQVDRSNKALVDVGFMTTRPRQLPGNRAFTTSEFMLRCH